jgi:hypothetical protein
MERGLQADPDHVGLNHIRSRFRAFQIRYWVGKLTGRRST